MKKNGFTLAEVLITLGIIGVVAALTMPALIAKYQEKEAAVRLKKLYSTLDNAMRLAVQENETVDNWGIVNYNDSYKITEKLIPYLKITKNCGMSSDSCGFLQGSYMNLKGDTDGRFNGPATDFSKTALADGMSIAIWGQDGNCALDTGNCGVIFTDINGGAKGPNIVGKDGFWFIIKKDRILPTGIQNDTSYPFETTCLNAGSNYYAGRGCTAWVIYNENLDYLHCPGELSWNGPTTCK